MTTAPLHPARNPALQTPETAEDERRPPAADAVQHVALLAAGLLQFAQTRHLLDHWRGIASSGRLPVPSTARTRPSFLTGMK